MSIGASSKALVGTTEWAGDVGVGGTSDARKCIGVLLIAGYRVMNARFDVFYSTRIGTVFDDFLHKGF